RIGRRVVPIRRREIDDLEVLRDLPEQVERTPSAVVVEGHERIVEEERRPSITRDEADETEPGGEVHEIQRALAERTDIDPITLLGGVEPDVERPVVDRDPSVTTPGDPRDVADHLLLEKAGCRL